MSKVLKNTFIYSAGNIIIALSSFVMLPIYTKYLSVEDFGLVNSMQIFSSVLIIFLTLAMERSLFRVSYDYSKTEEKSIFFGTILIAILTSCAIIIGIILLLPQLVQYLFKSIKFYPYFFYTILYSAILILVNYSQTISQVKQNAKGFLLISLVSFFATAFFNLFFIIYLNMGAQGYVLGMLCGVLTVIPLALLNFKNNIIFKWRFDMFKNAIYFSLPMLPNLLFAWVLNLSDRVIIDRYFSQADVGIYSLGYKIASLVIFGGTAFFQAYNPLFYEIANSNAENEAKMVIRKYNDLFTIIICFMGLTLLLFSDVILKLFFNEAYQAAFPYLFGFTVSFIISQLCGLFNLMIYQNKKSKQVAFVLIICGIINIGLNFLLIPTYGAFFGVLTSIIVSAINFALMFWLSKRNYFVKFNFLIPIVTLGIAGILYFTQSYVANLKFELQIILKVGLYLLIVTGLFLTQKNNIINLISSIKNKKKYPN